jgi:hypothetical protein
MEYAMSWSDAQGFSWEKKNFGHELQETRRQDELFRSKSTIFWDIMPCTPLNSTDFFEEHIASIFRVEHNAEQSSIIIPWINR